MSDWPEPKTPDQIEEEVVRYFQLLSERQTPGEAAAEAIAMFRRGLSKNGYVFYQP
jgi:hypothetical protein